MQGPMLSPQGIQRTQSIRGCNKLERAPSGRQLRVLACHTKDLSARPIGKPLQRSTSDGGVSPKRQNSSSLMRTASHLPPVTEFPVDKMSCHQANNVKVVPCAIPSEAEPAGAVHMELARMHALGVINEDEPDMNASLFHFRLAAQLGVPEAIWGLSQLYDGIEYVPLPGVQVKEPNAALSTELALAAAERGMSEAVFFAARNAQTAKARAVYYEKAIEMGGGDFTWGTAIFQLRAELAELLLGEAMGTGDGTLPGDPERAAELYTEAGEEAMGEMKMKLWQKYSMQAEEAYGYME